MKRIQMMRLAIVAVAIGGAFASKANKKWVITRYTVANTPGLPCAQVSSVCGSNGGICTSGSGPAMKTFYHANGTNLCAIALQQP